MTYAICLGGMSIGSNLNRHYLLPEEFPPRVLNNAREILPSCFQISLMCVRLL